MTCSFRHHSSPQYHDKVEAAPGAGEGLLWAWVGPGGGRRRRVAVPSPAGEKLGGCDTAALCCITAGWQEARAGAAPQGGSPSPARARDWARRGRRGALGCSSAARTTPAAAPHRYARRLEEPLGDPTLGTHPVTGPTTVSGRRPHCGARRAPRARSPPPRPPGRRAAAASRAPARAPSPPARPHTTSGELASSRLGPRPTSWGGVGAPGSRPPPAPRRPGGWAGEATPRGWRRLGPGLTGRDQWALLRGAARSLREERRPGEGLEESAARTATAALIPGAGRARGGEEGGESARGGERGAGAARLGVGSARTPPAPPELQLLLPVARPPPCAQPCSQAAAHPARARRQRGTACACTLSRAPVLSRPWAALPATGSGLGGVGTPDIPMPQTSVQKQRDQLCQDVPSLLQVRPPPTTPTNQQEAVLRIHRPNSFKLWCLICFLL
ncbi:translation initiation factor IF-2-like [Alexandromys fortis]|uniref:translation initiation factor IF-2-like n=1 Tax=Alexandromys fortis TaxID=100897 RepID=UPI0021534BFF|nr:translation initiation factor IF-2-like [Microtus fortis]